MKKEQSSKHKNNTKIVKDGFLEQSKGSFLPSPSILESYEEISPGIVEKLMDLAAAEQKHRHLLQNRSLRLSAFTSRIGQICGVAICLGIVCGASRLAIQGNFLMGAIILISGFSFLTAVALISSKTKRSMPSEKVAIKKTHKKNKKSK